MTTVAFDAISLLDLDPDLGRFLSEEDREDVRHQFALRTTAPERGPYPLETLLSRGAFGAIVLEGMVVQRLTLGSHVTMKIYGPGDLLARSEGRGSMVVGDGTFSSVEGTRLALFGSEMLAAMRRWPGLAVALQVRAAEQAERVAVQLAICQLPRVEERLMALFWWLAESWGRVTSVGTVLPVAMTHDVLGALVGARRPTVTLALGELARRGAIVRQDGGWLLLEPPPAPGGAPPEIDDPQVIRLRDPVWRAVEHRVSDTAAVGAELLETVSRLRAEHELRQAATRARLSELRATREAVTERRRKASATQAPVSPPRAPS